MSRRDLANGGKADELRRLRGCVRDLLVLSALSETWIGHEPGEVAGRLLDALLTTLRLDVGYARLTDQAGGPPVEAARADRCPEAARRAPDIGRALRPAPGEAAAPPSVPNPAGRGMVRIASMPIGPAGAAGMVVVGSQRPDFPTETETALLHAAVNMAATALRGTRALEALREADRQKAQILAREQAVRIEASAAAAEMRRINERLVVAGVREQELATEAESARRRATFLAEAGSILVGSLDADAMLASVARLAVPKLADWCFVDLRDGDRTTRRVAIAHADPAQAGLADELRHLAFDLDGPHAIARAVRTGQAELVAAVDDAWLAAMAQDAEHLRTMRALGSRSNMFVPLVARGRTLGVITLTVTGSGRRYGPADLSPAEELGRRAALAVDNARLYQEAQAAIRARDAFLARASHELRTPLTSALGTIRWLEKVMAGTARDRSESPASLLQIASRNLAAMRALVNDLLDGSKLLAGQEALAPEAVDVGEAVTRSLEVVAAEARDKGAVVRRVVPAGLAVLADSLKLEQVLVNLLANAVHFTPAGGEVVAEAEADGDRVVLRVRDTGVGIAREDLERIFEPFVQVTDPATRDGRPGRRRRGTGLGLTICRQIVALHAGRIWAESEGPGRGSVFVVTLPRARIDIGTPVRRGDTPP